MGEKFYLMSEGWATRYIILVIKEENKINSEIEFIKLIKENKIIFTEGQGKSEGDLLGGSWVTLFFSKKFIDLFKENEIKSLAYCPIKFESKYKNNGEFYYVELKSFVEFVGDGSYLKKDERERNQRIIDSWIERKNDIYYEGHEVRKGFYNLSTWDGSDFFGIKSGNLKGKTIVVTEKLKKIIEKAKLKNVQFKELKKYEYGK